MSDAEAETPILWPPDSKNWLIGEDPDAGKDWRQEKGTTEDCSVPPHSVTEQVSLKKVSTTALLVSGRKSDTEETSKQKKLKPRELPWKWQVQQIKTLYLVPTT